MTVSAWEVRTMRLPNPHPPGRHRDTPGWRVDAALRHAPYDERHRPDGEPLRWRP